MFEQSNKFDYQILFKNNMVKETLNDEEKHILIDFYKRTQILGNNVHPNYRNKINPFVPNAPSLYPLKTSENLTIF